MHQLQFIDENNGWAIGHINEYSGDRIFSSNYQWWQDVDKKRISRHLFYSDVFIDKDRGVILTEKEQMLITHDSGKTWDKQRIPIRKYPWHVSEIFLEKKIDK